ncbi:hypothetical protein [Streptomyces rubiginosohelvolus]|uniref:hypothetical protein n=1 Tax=Streptomyces rubiginosohelvolus TaxID=67362 RepID=UPI0035E23B4D
MKAITSESELHALDRALVVIDPEAGELLPGDPANPRPCEYTDTVERVRFILFMLLLAMCATGYWMTASLWYGRRPLEHEGSDERMRGWA